MSKKETENENEMIRTVATVATAPAWIPAAAICGVVWGAGKGLDKANDFGKENGPLAGLAAAPFILIGSIIQGPFSGVKRVGEALTTKKD